MCDDVLAEAFATARTIAENAPLAVRQAKKSIHYGLQMDLLTGYRFEIEAYNQLVGTEDRKEGVRAFNEKRKPKFPGQVARRHMTPPFRADHIGSLLRPKKLREAFRNLSGAELRAVQDECIREVMKLQKDCGLEILTDGEFRRISYWEKFVRLTRGLEVRDAVFTFHDAEGHESKFTAPYVSGKVSRTEADHPG